MHYFILFICFFFLNTSVQAQTVFNPPLTITTGGTYTGAYRSTNSEPGIRVITSQPVIIKNCIIQGPSDAIQSLDQNANITVQNCYIESSNPNITNTKKGFAFNVGNFRRLIINRNTFVNSPGIRAFNFGAGLAYRGQVLRVQYNYFRNIDGRLSDGLGSYLNILDLRSAGSAVGLNALSGADVEISWNQVINIPRQSSQEDLISTYASGGTLATPIKIHNNYLQGDYSPNPSVASDFSGVMVNIGDDPNLLTGWVNVYDNQIVSFQNAGIALYGGSNNKVYNNRLVSAKNAFDGTFLNGNFRNSYTFWDFYNTAALGNFVNNDFKDNFANVVGRDGNQVGPNIVPPGVILNTINLWAEAATTEDEINERNLWKTKLKNTGVQLGCYQLITGLSSTCNQL
jgi:chitinase